VVNISSTMDRMVGRGLLVYGTVKAALSHMTRLLAADLAPRVRVNAIAPGVVETDGLKAALTEEVRAQVTAATPLHRLASVDDVAAAAVWLARRDRLRDRLHLAVEQCHSVLAFGPPGSFKTHGLVLPAILEWQGNLVTTSIKPDVLRATCAHRASLGAVWVYDPLGLAGIPGARWTPLAHCQTYADARRIGRMLADAADVQGHKADDANYWQLLGAKLLSVLLFAAAGTGRSMADVARWVDVQDVDDVAQALIEIGNQQALDAWAACTSRPDNTMGSVYGTAETLLDVYGDPTIAQSAEGCDLDLDELLTGANNTLYLYAPASEQERLRPLFELLVSS
jgi:type IV secretion system protein VirD4